MPSNASPSRQAFNLDYIDVATRIQGFRDKFPGGSLQQVSIDFREVAGVCWVIYTAAAYRTPDDERPGHGTAWEQIPGLTPFTRGSEVQNAETAAWGRAIVAVLQGDMRRIASAEEVRSAQDRQTAPPPNEPDPVAALRVAVAEAAKAANVPLAEVEADWAAAHDGQFIGDATDVGFLELLRDDLLERAR